MARLARVVVSGVPHRVTQRGNRRQIVFFGDDDYRSYLALLKEHARSAGVATWAWCLMPNHVHLMLVPPTPDALRQMLSEAHRRYSRMVNFREGWRGYLWQGRFASCPLDETHALAGARYIELNPVRARLVAGALDWPWSSARAHLTGHSDGLTEIGALGIRTEDWPGFWLRVSMTQRYRRCGVASTPAGRLATQISSRAWRRPPAACWHHASVVPSRDANATIAIMPV